MRPPVATRLISQGATSTSTLGEVLVSVYVTSTAPLSGTGASCLVNVTAEPANPPIDASALVSLMTFVCASMSPV